MTSIDADADAALRSLALGFPDVRIQVAPGGSGFGFAYQRIATESFSVHRMRCSGLLRAVGPIPEAVSIGRRTAGEVRVRLAGRSVDTGRPFLRPVAPAEFEVRDGSVMLVALQPSAVASYMERSGERARPRRLLETAPRLTGWSLVMDHAATFLDDPDALTPQAAAELADLLCWSLLQAFEDPWAETGRSGARSSALRRALHHIDEHADGRLLMPDVAAAARVSVRTLETLFRRELDTTPLRWLHDVRLDRARQDLLAGSGTVREVAARHGLPHGGRFAAQYAARFAEHPATTLRGVRGGTRAGAEPPRGPRADFGEQRPD